MIERYGHLIFSFGKKLITSGPLLTYGFYVDEFGRSGYEPKIATTFMEWLYDELIYKAQYWGPRWLAY